MDFQDMQHQLCYEVGCIAIAWGHIERNIRLDVLIWCRDKDETLDTDYDTTCKIWMREIKSKFANHPAILKRRAKLEGQLESARVMRDALIHGAPTITPRGKVRCLIKARRGQVGLAYKHTIERAKRGPPKQIEMAKRLGQAWQKKQPISEILYELEEVSLMAQRTLPELSIKISELGYLMTKLLNPAPGDKFD